MDWPCVCHIRAFMWVSQGKYVAVISFVIFPTNVSNLARSQVTF